LFWQSFLIGITGSARYWTPLCAGVEPRTLLRGRFQNMRAVFSGYPQFFEHGADGLRRAIEHLHKLM